MHNTNLEERANMRTEILGTKGDFNFARRQELGACMYESELVQRACRRLGERRKDLLRYGVRI